MSITGQSNGASVKPRPLHRHCQKCGWRMGGVDSWNGRACRCGNTSEPMQTCEACNGLGVNTDVHARLVCAPCGGSGLVTPR